jgi:hypothetical protein
MLTRARSSIHFWAASRNGCTYGRVLLRNVIEKRVLGMSKTREEALASIQKRLVCLQDSIRCKTEPLDHSTRLSQEIVTMRTLLAITYEFLPDEIALQIKATLDLVERGVPTGV